MRLKTTEDPFWIAVGEIELRIQRQIEPELASALLLRFSRLLDLLPADIIEVRMMAAVCADDKLRLPCAVTFPGPLLKSLLAALRTDGVCDLGGHIDDLLSRHVPYAAIEETISVQIPEIVNLA